MIAYLGSQSKSVLYSEGTMGAYLLRCDCDLRKDRRIRKNMLETMGWISIIPVALAVILAFVTRNTIISLGIACITGCLIAGKGIFGFTDLLKDSLGNSDFIWVVTINMMVAVMVAYFEKSGAINGFTLFVDKKNLKRKSIQIVAWF